MGEGERVMEVIAFLFCLWVVIATVLAMETAKLQKRIAETEKLLELRELELAALRAYDGKPPVNETSPQ